MTFESFLCWRPENVDRIALIDVAGVAHERESDSAVFLATHQPLHLLRLPGAGAKDGELISEQELLDEFSRPLGPDPRIAVITGAVGTGKSHMVKWLHAHSSDRSGWHQVYVEKRNTNLRRVIETILAGLSGPRIAELLEKLQIASSAIRDLDEAKSKVLHELAFFVEYPSGGSDEGSEFEREARRQLLPILSDPVLSGHLLRDDGAVHRITRLGLEGLRDDDENEHDLFFREEDLPLRPADLLDASQPAQRAVRRLGSHTQLRGIAVEILNRELAAAKATVFVGSGIELTAVFDEVRRELAVRDLELVLYIEDFVLLHGIDRELAQVFTESRGTGGDRCGIRVAIAVTEGYLASGLETLTSRAQHYSLNLRLGAHVSTDQTRTFVGRYLNAIRLGPELLRSARTRATDLNWVPNACDSCDFQEDCHAGFGADANSFGFYPLNGIAVDRLVMLADTATTNEGRFDPRKVIRHVVRDPLQEAAAKLPDHRFPSASFGAGVDPTRRAVTTEVRARLDETLDGDRRIALLGFWAPEPVREIVNLDPIIHQAFHLPAFEGAAISRGSDVVDTGPRRRYTRGPEEWPDIESWANEAKVLPSARARAIRQYVYDAVLEAVRNGPLGVRVKGQSRKFLVGSVGFDENCVRIEAAQGGGAEVERPFEIIISRSSKMAVMLKALLAAERDGQWSPDNYAEYADFVGHVDAWAAQLAKLASRSTVDLDAVCTILAVTSQPAIATATTVGERLEIAIQARLDPGLMGSSWAVWAKDANRARQRALSVLDSALTSAKGSGASSFLDAATISQRFEKVGRVRRIGDTLKGSEEFVTVLRSLRDKQVQAAKQGWREVQQLLERLEPYVDSSSTWERLRGDVERAVGRAHAGGLLPVASAKDDLSVLAELVPPDALTVLGRLRRKAVTEVGDLWDLVPDPVPPLQALLTFCTAVDENLSALEMRLERQEENISTEMTRGSATVAFRSLADSVDSVLEWSSSVDNR